MKRSSGHFVVLLAACLLLMGAAPARAGWHQDYRNAQKALDQKDYKKAEKLLRQALKGRREPGKNLLPSVGLLGGVIDNYCPRLMLAAALSGQEGRDEEKAQLLAEAWSIEREFFGEAETRLYEGLTRTGPVKAATPPPTPLPLPAKPEIFLEQDGGGVRVVWEAEAGTDYEVLIADRPSAEGSSVRRFFPVRSPFPVTGEAPGRHHVSVRARNQAGKRLSDWKSFDVPEPPVVSATPSPAPVRPAGPTFTPTPVLTPPRPRPSSERTQPPVPATPPPTPAPPGAAGESRDAAAMIADDLDRAVAALRRGETAAALAVLEAIVRSDPKNGRACFHLAACYGLRFIDSGERDRALRERALSFCRRARTLNPSLPWRSEIQNPAVLLVLDAKGAPAAD